MHAVINLATMAMRWKRAINNETSTAEKAIRQSASTTCRTEQENLANLHYRASQAYQRKRASSLLGNESSSAGLKPLAKRLFISNNRLNDTSKPITPLNWYKQRDKQLQPLPERSSKSPFDLPRFYCTNFFSSRTIVTVIESTSRTRFDLGSQFSNETFAFVYASARSGRRSKGSTTKFVRPHTLADSPRFSEDQRRIGQSHRSVIGSDAYGNAIE